MVEERQQLEPRELTHVELENDYPQKCGSGLTVFTDANSRI